MDLHLRSAHTFVPASSSGSDKVVLANVLSKRPSAAGSFITCPQCPLRFGNIDGINLHLRTAHKPAIESSGCRAEVETFESEQELFQLGCKAVKEVASKHMIKTATTRIAERIRRISFHYQQYHNTTLLKDASLYKVPLTKNFVHCTLCKDDDLMIFPNEQALGKHKQECHKEMDYFCDFCDVTSVRWNEYLRHLFTHVKQNLFGNYLCPYCDENINLVIRDRKGRPPSRPFTVSHLYSHIQKRYFPHECEVCSDRFYSDNKLREHMNSTHTGARTYICEDCGKGFKTSGSRSTHRSSVHLRAKSRKQGSAAAGGRIRRGRQEGDIEGEYQCSLCKDVEHSYLDYVQHLHGHFQLCDGRWICSWCDKDITNPKLSKGNVTFRYNHHLIHMPREYYREVCQFCSKRFAIPGKLKDHIAVMHNGVLNYQCAHCDQKFATSVKKNDHEAVVHTGEMRHNCKYCGEKFLTCDRRSTHIKAFHKKK